MTQTDPTDDPAAEAETAAAYSRALATPPSAEAGAYIRDRLAQRAPAPAVVSPPTDRAAVLLEAANTVDAMNEGCSRAQPCTSCNTREDVADVLRRSAAETQQQPATEARTDRAAVERAFAERLAAELKGCCTECDACIEIAQHLAGSDQPATEAPKLPPMDPVHILGIHADVPASVAQQPAAEVRHAGGNAEDCPACIADGLNKLGYPWICPEGEQQPAAADDEETQS
ncbi:hypothetical protein [Streptomyces sp. NPDC008240]|uniref:hypothetical protein n=1 Tax=Streptomyces sp. NPDC008240 TaxID=3364822 RepID=UPI0036EB2053